MIARSPTTARRSGSTDATARFVFQPRARLREQAAITISAVADYGQALAIEPAQCARHGAPRRSLPRRSATAIGRYADYNEAIRVNPQHRRPPMRGAVNAWLRTQRVRPRDRRLRRSAPHQCRDTPASTVSRGAAYLEKGDHVENAAVDHRPGGPARAEERIGLQQSWRSAARERRSRSRDGGSRRSGSTKSKTCQYVCQSRPRLAGQGRQRQGDRRFQRSDPAKSADAAGLYPSRANSRRPR